MYNMYKYIYIYIYIFIYMHYIDIIYQTTQFEYRGSGSPRALRFSPHVQVPRRRLRRWRQMSRCHERTRRSDLWMARFPVTTFFIKIIYTYYLVVGFKDLFYFPFHIWDNPSHWRTHIFKMVKTTNQLCIYIYTLIHSFIHTFIRTYIHTYTQTYRHTYIYIYIYMVLPLETTAELQPCKSVTKPRKYQQKYRKGRCGGPYNTIYIYIHIIMRWYVYIYI